MQKKKKTRKYSCTVRYSLVNIHYNDVETGCRGIWWWWSLVGLLLADNDWTPGHSEFTLQLIDWWVTLYRSEHYIFLPLLMLLKQSLKIENPIFLTSAIISCPISVHFSHSYIIAAAIIPQYILSNSHFISKSGRAWNLPVDSSLEF